MAIKNPQSVHTTVNQVNVMLAPIQALLTTQAESLRLLTDKISLIENNVSLQKTDITNLQNNQANNTKAFISWTISGVVLTITSATNISSIVRNSVGNYKITFTDLVPANAAISITPAGNPPKAFSVISQSARSITVQFTSLLNLPVDTAGSIAVLG